MRKTVLITGTSTGFGKATAKKFAREGWNVIATMRSPEAESELVTDETTLVTRLDVQDRTSIDAAIATGIAKFGRIDALVNNAGYGLHGIFEATDREKIQHQFDVNVFGVMDVTRAILPHFRANKAGMILNISSGAGVFTVPMLSAYCASKFALEGFSEALSYELLAQNIVVKIIEPGGVLDTQFVARSGGEAVQNPVIDDYRPFLAQAERSFTNMKQARLGTSEGVANVIFEAATDGKEQLRYLGTEDIAPLLKLRRETSETQYLAAMRGNFLRRG